MWSAAEPTYIWLRLSLGNGKQDELSTSINEQIHLKLCCAGLLFFVDHPSLCDYVLCRIIILYTMGFWKVFLISSYKKKN